MFTNRVGKFLSILASNISAIQIEAGGAVNAYNQSSQEFVIRLAERRYLEGNSLQRCFRVQRYYSHGLILATNSLYAIYSFISLNKRIMGK